MRMNGSRLLWGYRTCFGLHMKWVHIYSRAWGVLEYNIRTGSDDGGLGVA